MNGQARVDPVACDFVSFILFVAWGLVSVGARQPHNPIRLEPTGILFIEVSNYYSGGPQEVWRDRENTKLEEQLPKCVAGMMRIALKERADDQARRERELVWQKKIDEVAAELEEIEGEERKIRLKRREVLAWHRAERIAPLTDPKSIVDDKEEALRRLHSVQWG